MSARDTVVCWDKINKLRRDFRYVRVRDLAAAELYTQHDARMRSNARRYKYPGKSIACQPHLNINVIRPATKMHSASTRNSVSRQLRRKLPLSVTTWSARRHVAQECFYAVRDYGCIALEP
ncbi:hypothetical protein NDU88_000171 [Pleurodeles waltl]|uniref:Uncharacterized protein n=1 Tax=Pleurodeles waltl TaxID=8319 RepID=A0AAV7UP82_PLEWA|nr:hypothetical protein NDU88_000171 [Pleurodeles waltl]